MVMKILSKNYTINGSEITFTAAADIDPNTDTITALLHSEEKLYSFDITATDQANLKSNQRTFSMNVNKPGVAWIDPKRPLNTTVDVPYVAVAGVAIARTVELRAATSNTNNDGTYKEVELSLSAPGDIL